MGLIFLILSCWNTTTGLPDSLRKEVIDGKVFVIHRVDPKETLYGLSRRYRVPINQILKFNDTRTTGLYVGQIVKIPFAETIATNNTAFHGVQPGKQPSLSPSSKKDPEKIHRVQRGETLYALAGLYNTTVTKLKQWNGLTENTLHVGQAIRVSNDSPARKSDVADQPAPTENRQKHPPVSISESITGTDEITERGWATLIDGEMGKRKYLALHDKTAKGAILKVRNMKNNLEVFVRVIGSIPDTNTKKDTIIQISQSAFERLGGLSKTPIQAEITYYK